MKSSFNGLILNLVLFTYFNVSFVPFVQTYAEPTEQNSDNNVSSAQQQAENNPNFSNQVNSNSKKSSSKKSQKKNPAPVNSEVNADKAANNKSSVSENQNVVNTAQNNQENSNMQQMQKEKDTKKKKSKGKAKENETVELSNGTESEPQNVEQNDNTSKVPEDLPNVEPTEITFPEVVSVIPEKESKSFNYIAGFVAWILILLGVTIVLFVLIKGKKSVGDAPVQNIYSTKKRKRKYKGKHLLPDKYYADRY